MDPAITSLFTIASSGIAAYYGAYFKKRGEEKAIADGFAEVLKQTSEMTEATKAIEAQISDEVWSRQRQWEAKRDVLFECTKQGIRLRYCIEFLENQYSDEDVPADEKEARDKARKDATDDFDETIAFLRANTSLAELMCFKETTELLYVYSDATYRLAKLIMNPKRDENYLKTRGDLWQLADALSEEIMAAIRNELGIPENVSPPPPTITSQSTGSSAAPIPAAPTPEAK
jgi:hypothetical protein